MRKAGSFLKHGKLRWNETDVSSENLERLNEGVRLAGRKGAEGAADFSDSTAYVV